MHLFRGFVIQNILENNLKKMNKGLKKVYNEHN